MEESDGARGPFPIADSVTISNEVESRSIASTASPAAAQRWAMLALLLVAFVFNHVDRSIISILQDPIKHEFGISDTQLGLMTGFAFALLHSISTMPFARLADRGWGSEVIAISFAAFSFLTLGSGLATSFTFLLLMRIGVGIGEGGGVAPSTALIVNLFPQRERGRAMGLYMLGPPLGVMFGILIGGLVSDRWGWRTAFVSVGAIGALLAPVVYAVVKRAARGMASLASTQSPPIKFVDALRELWRIKAYRNVILAGLFLQLAHVSIVAWTPSFYIRVHGLSASHIGLYLGLMLGIGGGLGVMAGGWLADRFARRDARWFVWLPALSALLIMPAMWTQYLVPSANMSLLFAVVPNFLAYSTLGPYFASVLSLAQPRIRATAHAVQGFAVVTVSVGLGPLIVGIASDHLAAQGVEHTLRYVLPAMSLLNIAAIGFFLRAGRTYAAECHHDASPGDALH